MILFQKCNSQGFSGIYLEGEVKLPNFTTVKRVAGSHICYWDFPEEIDGVSS